MCGEKMEEWLREYTRDPETRRAACERVKRAMLVKDYRSNIVDLLAPVRTHK